MKSSSNWIALIAGLCLLAATAHAGKPESPGGGNGGGGGAPAACDPAAVDAALASVAAACPCDGQTDAAGDVVPWKNHGKYVRCVAHATKDAIAASDGAVTRRCMKDAVRCAARSTCGKREGTVNCTRTRSATCVAEACPDGDACTSDADCAVSTCSFRRTAADCTASGGVPGTGSCCAPAPIGSPSGAFVDRAARPVELAVARWGRRAGRVTALAVTVCRMLRAEGCAGGTHRGGARARRRASHRGRSGCCVERTRGQPGQKVSGLGVASSGEQRRVPIGW